MIVDKRCSKLKVNCFKILNFGDIYCCGEFKKGKNNGKIIYEN